MHKVIVSKCTSKERNGPNIVRIIIIIYIMLINIFSNHVI